jgi:simple sugar transport system ATP-binding protein
VNGAGVTAAVELRGLSKRFGDCQANQCITLTVKRGSIHGIVGENGAGKSTAMKMLYGLFRPDSGEIIVSGASRHWRSPADAIKAGIGMVHQHFMLASSHTAFENIILSNQLPAFGLFDQRSARERLQNLARDYGLDVPWDTPVEDMPVGTQQRVEILKLLYRDAEILIMDEPTAVLTPQETKSLFSNLKKLKQQGKTILLITHKLREVMEFTDHITVFRAGKVVGDRETTESNPEELAELMVGRKVAMQITVAGSQPQTGFAIEMVKLSLTGRPGSRHRLQELSFGVRRGEIVGIAGVEGNGQSELVQALLHPRDPTCRSSGGVKILGNDVTSWPARKIRDLGVAVIPEDRLHEGLIPGRPVEENFLLGLQRGQSMRRRGLLDFSQVVKRAREAMREYDVRPSDVRLAAGRLSGGNQQKLIVAREFERSPRVLVAAQPTRGVDVGSIEFIHRRIVMARDEGAGVLLISSELEEILALSDRILIMYEGRINGQFRRGEADERMIGLKMAGG